jgi:hypothetical protein
MDCPITVGLPSESIPISKKPDFTPREPARIEKVRLAFVEREDRLTYQQLADEFNVPKGTISVAAADESWISMRAAHQEKLAAKSDAMGIILKACQTDQKLINSVADVSLYLLGQILMTVQEVPAERAASTKMEILNTATFSLKNISDAIKNVGLVGFSKDLGAAGKEANGQWNPQMLQQINVNVGEIIAKARSELGASLPVQASEPTAKAE